MFAKFDQFLREVLKLPTAVFEGPSFGYTEHSVRTCFPQQVWGAAPRLSLYPSDRCFFNTWVCVRVCVLIPEEDCAEHVSGCADGRSSPSMPRVAAPHAPTCQC